jgi:transposase
MPRPYSADLRERVLLACEAGEGSQAQLAARYRIGERTLSRWRRTAHKEGRRGPKPPAHGRTQVGGGGAVLAELVAARDDATLAEYAGGLAERTGVRRSLAAVCRALKALGLVRKKRRSGRPSGTAPMSPSGGHRGTPTWPGSRPSGWSSSTRPALIPG